MAAPSPIPRRDQLPAFEVYPDTAGGFRWRFLARNGLIMADSAESYSRLADALRGIRDLCRKIRRGPGLPPIRLGLRRS